MTTSAKIELSFALVQTKLQPQQVSHKPILRNKLKLFAQAELENYRIISVVAAAGYGKSTLLAQWQAELQQKKIPRRTNLKTEV